MTETPDTAAASDVLRLRSARPPVVRLSRRVLFATGAVAAVGLAGAVAFAMVDHRAAAPPTELYKLGARPSEQVRVLPVDYGTPKLGPPLPGDLGAPILAAGAPVPAMGETEAEPAGSGAAPPAAQARAEERNAARLSRLFFQNREAARPLLAPGVVTDVLGPSAGAIAATGRAGAEDRRTTNSERLVPAASPYVVQAGTVIPAALVTAIQSDLPGQVVGQVTQDVYDSPTGRVLLIPQGARLVGVYENRVAFGQRRVLLAWTRLLLPDGRSLVLENLPAADLAGHAGLEDRVDRHWSGLFGMAVLSTVLGVGAELGRSDDESEWVRALRDGGAGTLNQVGQQATGHALARAPTLTIRAGAPLRVLVTRDLVLEPLTQEIAP